LTVSRVSRVGVWVFATLAGVGCRSQDDAFYAKVWPCDPTAPTNSCGTTRDGKPMVCFEGSQLGGVDFCAPACDPTSLAEPGFTCLSSGALLQACHPNADAGVDDPSSECAAGLECYRTDLLLNEGVCVDMRVCTDDSDCTGTTRTVCASTLIRALTASPFLQTDHLECVQATCTSGGQDCMSGESCLADYYVARDICVPNCDNMECPPNFACSRGAGAPGSPPICLPGLPGQRCEHDQDCIVGNCVDTGANFNECVLPLPCAVDSDCAFLEGTTSPYVCVDNVALAGRYCFATAPFAGSNCSTLADCAAGEICYTYSPYVPDQGHGECRVPCATDLSCPVRGGIPHTCLDGGQGGCYPGIFGMPCASSTDCLDAFECLTVSPDPRTLITSPTICTLTCTSDADCQVPIVGDVGFCDDAEGLCRLAGPPGAPCDRDAQCRAGTCPLDTSGNGQCVAD
jgi:hypothetical protein